MNSTMSLEQLQRTMAAAVMQPLTADELMQPVNADGRLMSDVAAEFIQPNSLLTSFDRLEIYNRQYWFRLRSAFTEDFPALRAVVGPARFEPLMNAYLTAHPSRSFTLRNLGSRLHTWLTANPSFAGSRFALALDVIQVEWACVEAFDNAELPPLSLAEVAALGADSRLGLQPHVQLLALSYPADDFVLQMHQRQKRESSEAGSRADHAATENIQPLRMRKKSTWLAIHRADDSLYYKPLTRPEYQTLTALRAGATLPEALQTGFAGARIAAPKQLALVQQWFTNWAELGWLCSPVPEPLSS